MMQNKEQEQEQNEMRGSARLFERIAWGVLLVCAADMVMGLGLLAPGMSVFLTTLAATLLVIGIIVRKKAEKV